MKLEELTEKQRQFVLHYLQNGFNATQAAISAGYSKDSARVIGCENLTKPDIQDAIKEHIDRIGITPEKIKSAVAEIAFADPADFDRLSRQYSLAELREDGCNTRVVKKIKTRMEAEGDRDDPQYFEVREVEFYDRLSALEKLAKIYAMMTDVQRVEGEMKLYDSEHTPDDI